MKKMFMFEPDFGNDQDALHWQWLKFRSQLISAGVEVHNIEGQNPDKTSSVGVIYDDTFYTSVQDSVKQIDSMELIQVNLADDSKIKFNGKDAIFSHDRKHLWLGINHETNLEGKVRLDHLLNEDVIVYPLLMKKKFNLEDCFLPLDGGELIYYPDAFDSHSNMIIESWYRDKIIFLTSEDVRQFAANSISINKTIIMPYASEDLKKILTSKGYSVVIADVSELGGKCKSLVLESIK